jgi:TonB family protein
MTFQDVRSPLASVALHTLLVAFLLLLGARSGLMEVSPRAVSLAPPPPRVKVAYDARIAGGGQQDRLPPTRGSVPVTHRPFVIPVSVPVNLNPKLVIESGIDVDLPQAHLPAVLGDPLSTLSGPPGLGTGKRGVGGPGQDGVGPNSSRGLDTTGTLARYSTAPVLLHKVEPDYSEEARKAKFQGTVLLSVEIDEQGSVRAVRVTRPVGLGLDEKAIEAVRRWRFKPALRDGKPVATPAAIEVNFRLL